MATVRLRDGRDLGVRPPSPSDHRALLRFLKALPPESRQLRFFSVACDLDAAARWAAGADGSDHIGLIALDGEEDRIVAHAACIRLYGRRGEVAVEVDEAYRRLGLASQLLREVAHRADQQGIRHLVAEVLPENHEMLAVFHDEFAADASREDGEVSITFPSAAWCAAPTRS